MNEYDFDSEESIDLSPEEQEVAAAMGLGVSTKRLSKKAYAEFKKKAEDIVAQSSVPSKTAREAAKGIVKGGGQKSAEVSARAFQKALEKGPIRVPSGPVISDVPQISGRMGAAMEKAAAAAKGIPWSPADGVINLPSSAKPSFLQKIATLASNPSNQKALAGIGLGAGALAVLSKLAAPVQAVTGLYGQEGEGPEPNDPYLNPPKKLDYTPPSTEKSDLNPPMSSSMYDSLGSIISDTSRPPVLEERAPAAKEEPAEKILAPTPRTVSAGEPTAAAVAKQAEDAQLAQILGQKSEYEDLLARYKDAQERQRLAQLGISLGQAGERIGSAIAMVKPGDQSFYEQQMKLAGGITDEFKEEEAIAREAKRNDPNSEESKSARALLKEQGITVPETVTAAFIEKQYPQFANIISQRRAAEERAEGRRERREEREFALKSRDQQRDDDFIFRGMEKLTADPTYKARQKIIRGKSLVDEAVKNPTSFGDVASLYTAITALDPESVVREGEIKLTREGESLGESIQRQVRRLGPNPRLLGDRLLSDIKKYVDLIDKQTGETYNLKRDALFQQAENRGIEKSRYKAMDPFLLKEERAPQAAEKVVVEKDGKRYRLPKEQLQRALSQGYKEVK